MLNKEDRDLLELAAKAAGIEWTAHGDFISGAPYLRAKNAPLGMWAPLTDDGDALRLAVKLRLHVEVFNGIVWAHNEMRSADGLEHVVERGATTTEDDEQERCAATRRVIVKAAAAIAELAKEPQ